MNIGILGTGTVAQTLGAHLLELGHNVAFGTRNITNTMQKTKPDNLSDPPFSVWIQNFPGINLVTMDNAAAHGDVLINATSGAGSLNALSLAGKDNLSGKILLDISNPLDFSQGFPPSLSVCNTDSLAEQIQNAYPSLKVVKTLNTVASSIMVNPALVPGEHNLFVSGNDADAKTRVIAYLSEWFGWPQGSIIDLGDISTARGTEMLLPIWLRLYGSLNSTKFNFHIAVG